MNSPASNTTSTVVPCFRYADAPAAIEWLCAAFGFERQMVVPGEGDAVAHAQLTFGNGMIMLCSDAADEFSELHRAPKEVGFVTHAAYLIVDDVDAHHARAVDHGAQIVRPPTDEDYGGRGYSCRDPEGQLWHFGSYDPWIDE